MKKLINWVVALCCTIVFAQQTNACQCFYAPQNIVDAFLYRLQTGENADDIYILKVKVTDTFSTNCSGLNSAGFKLQVLQQYSGGTVLSDTVMLSNANGNLCYGGLPFSTPGDTVILDCSVRTYDSVIQRYLQFFPSDI